MTCDPNPSSYPRTCLCASDCLQQFQPKWTKIQEASLDYYSVHINGIYCQTCPVFTPEIVGGQVPGVRFVTKEFNNWIKIGQTL